MRIEPMLGYNPFIVGGMTQTEALVALTFTALFAALLALYFILPPRLRTRVRAWIKRATKSAPPDPRESEVGVFTGLPPQEALDRVTLRMIREGYVLAGRTPNSATFTLQRGANPLVGLILLLFFLLPGILYLLLAQRNSSVTFMAHPEGDGSRLFAGGNSPDAVRGAYYWARTSVTPLT